MAAPFFHWTPQLLSPAARTQRLLLLAIALVPIGGSILLNWGIQIPVWGCPLLHMIGVPCPGWGLTRSFMATARGEWAVAFDVHFFGPFLFLGCLLGLAHISAELLSNRPLQAAYLPWLRSGRVQIFCFLLLVGFHLTRLQHLWHTGTLQQTIRQSRLGPWLTDQLQLLTHWM